MPAREKRPTTILTIDDLDRQIDELRAQLDELVALKEALTRSRVALAEPSA